MTADDFKPVKTFSNNWVWEMVPIGDPSHAPLGAEIFVGARKGDYIRLAIVDQSVTEKTLKMPRGYMFVSFYYRKPQQLPSEA